MLTMRGSLTLLVIACSMPAQAPMRVGAGRFVVDPLIERYAPQSGDADRVIATGARCDFARSMTQCLRAIRSDPVDRPPYCWPDGKLFADGLGEAGVLALAADLEALRSRAPGQVVVRLEWATLGGEQRAKLQVGARPRPVAAGDVEAVRDVLRDADDGPKGALQARFTDLEAGIVRDGRTHELATDFTLAGGAPSATSAPLFTGTELGLVAMPRLGGEGRSVAVAFRWLEHALAEPVAERELRVRGKTLRLQEPHRTTHAVLAAGVAPDGGALLLAGPADGTSHRVGLLTVRIATGDAVPADMPRATRDRDALAPVSTEPPPDDDVWRAWAGVSDYACPRGYVQDPAMPGHSLYYHYRQLGSWLEDDRDAARAFVQRFLAIPSNAAVKEIQGEAVRPWAFDFFGGIICYRVHRPAWFAWTEQALHDGFSRQVGDEWLTVGTFPVALRSRANLRWLAEYHALLHDLGKVLRSNAELGAAPFALRQVIDYILCIESDFGVPDRYAIRRGIYELDPDTGIVRARVDRVRVIEARRN